MSFRAQRWPVEAKAYVKSQKGAVPIEVRNVAPRGICIQAPDPYRVGETLDFSLAGRDISGRIVWSRHRLNGVVLETALDRNDLAVLRKVPHRSLKSGMPRASWQGHQAGRYTEL